MTLAALLALELAVIFAWPWLGVRSTGSGVGDANPAITGRQ